jgi:hypothetical protein
MKKRHRLEIGAVDIFLAEAELTGCNLDLRSTGRESQIASIL